MTNNIKAAFNMVQERYLIKDMAELDRVLSRVEISKDLADYDMKEVRRLSPPGPTWPSTVWEGTLVSRIFSLAEDTAGFPSHGDWQGFSAKHPAYEGIRKELQSLKSDRRLDTAMDTLEGIGCQVGYDKTTRRFTVGMDLSVMRKDWFKDTHLDRAWLESDEVEDLGSTCEFKGDLIGPVDHPTVLFTTWQLF